jgi:hypothetical protein
MAHREPVSGSTFLVERYWPGVTRAALDAAVDRVRQALPSPGSDGTVVAHIATLLLDTDEVVFCLFNAANREAVEAVNERADFPFDRIVEGTWLSWPAADGHAQPPARRRRARRSVIASVGVACALLLGACGGGTPQPSGAGSASGGATTASTTAGTAGQSPARAAASASSGAGGSGPALDQCSLLTPDEITAATGLQVVRAGADPVGLSRCVWTLSGTGRNEIGLSVDLNDPSATRDQEFDCKVGFGLKPLADVGDTACASTVTGGEYELAALRGDDRVRLRISSDLNYVSSIKKSAWAALARAVFARLG